MRVQDFVEYCHAIQDELPTTVLFQTLLFFLRQFPHKNAGSGSGDSHILASCRCFVFTPAPTSSRLFHTGFSVPGKDRSVPFNVECDGDASSEFFKSHTHVSLLSILDSFTVSPVLSEWKWVVCGTRASGGRDALKITKPRRRTLLPVNLRVDGSQGALRRADDQWLHTWRRLTKYSRFLIPAAHIHSSTFPSPLVAAASVSLFPHYYAGPIQPPYQPRIGSRRPRNSVSSSDMALRCNAHRSSRCHLIDGGVAVGFYQEYAEAGFWACPPIGWTTIWEVSDSAASGAGEAISVGVVIGLRAIGRRQVDNEDAGSRLKREPASDDWIAFWAVLVYPPQMCSSYAAASSADGDGRSSANDVGRPGDGLSCAWFHRAYGYGR
ncbi:hypothetical protein R3P38DRAFT_2792735 [Favolaschia claudopus]|uniref:Uncharacterized protein n=1 Tax=Favolaschia claudopus TaxID=2862362 RepID=A0AAW0AEI6_9AGAR